MAWRKAPAEVVARFESLLPGAPAEPRKMFGYPCAFVNGQMFMGVFQDVIILRLAPDARAALLEVDGAEIFSPMPGRQMKEYVVVPPSVLEDPAEVRAWVARSLAFARSLPPKNKAPRKAAARKSAT